MTQSRSFYVGAIEKPGKPAQSVSDDLEGFEAIYRILGVPTFPTDTALIDALKGAGYGPDTENVRAYKVTVEFTEA